MKIVAFGDSITQGTIGVTAEQNWLRILERKLGESYKLINAGMGGNSAREAMTRYERDVLTHNPNLIFLEFGGNNNDPHDLKRHVKDSEFKLLLLQFQTGLPEKCRVVMIVFPPIIDEWHAWAPCFPAHQVDSTLEPQREIVRDFAIKNGWPLLDLHNIMYARRYELILPDGVHLTPAGQIVFAEEMYNLMKQQGWIKQ